MQPNKVFRAQPLVKAIKDILEAGLKGISKTPLIINNCAR